VLLATPSTPTAKINVATMTSISVKPPLERRRAAFT
jgi:hypothetical protein